MIDPVLEGLYQIKLLVALRHLTGEKPQFKALGDPAKQTKKEESSRKAGNGQA